MRQVRQVEDGPSDALEARKKAGTLNFCGRGRYRTHGRGAMTIRREHTTGLILVLLAIGALFGSNPAGAGGSTTVISARTGNRYEMVHTCLSGQTTLRDTPLATSRSVERKVEVFAGTDSAATFGRSGFDESGATNLAVYTNLGWVLTALELTDRYEGDFEFQSVTRLPINCPSYKSLPRTVFAPVAPIRLLDTRRESQVGYVGNRPLAASTTTVQIAGRGVFPANTVAAVINLTATNPSGAGFVQAMPTGAAPGSSSTLNIERAGQTLANGAIATLGSDGRLSIFTAIETDLIVDVVGYFTPVSGPSTAGRFIPSNPVRILDTRPWSAVNYAADKPKAGAMVRVSAVASGSPVPAGKAGAVVVGLTVTETSGPGFFQVAAGGSLVPGASSVLNSDSTGQTIANTITVPLASDGTFDVYTQLGAHVIIDVLGWYTNATNVASTRGL
jgi:hypothetical protein